MKYNKSEIMKKAWIAYRQSNAHGKVNVESFAQCLRNAWSVAKYAVLVAKGEAERAASGIVKMKYSEYKNNYATCKTVNGSYDKATKTIEVYTKGVVTTNTATASKTVKSERLVNGNDGFYSVITYTDGTTSKRFVG